MIIGLPGRCNSRIVRDRGHRAANRGHRGHRDRGSGLTRASGSGKDRGAYLPRPPRWLRAAGVFCSGSSGSGQKQYNCSGSGCTPGANLSPGRFRPGPHEYNCSGLMLEWEKLSRS